MSARNPVDFSHQANASLLAGFQASAPEVRRSRSPQEVDTWNLGTHPDLVEYFWHHITTQLPESCQWVVYDRPVLANPTSGVIFGVAGGTSTLVLRLPETERELAFQVPGYSRSYQYPIQTTYASDYGDDFALIKPYLENRIETWCLRAYEYAAQLK